MRRVPFFLASAVLVLTTASAYAEWKYFSPASNEPNVHRAFAYAESGDDRMEIACNANRRDLFYSTAKTVSAAELTKLKSGKPVVLIRLEGVGVLPLDADNAFQKHGRLLFVTAVKPLLIKDLGKASQSIAAGMRADGKIVQQGLFPTDGLQAAIQKLAAGCGF